MDVFLQASRSFLNPPGPSKNLGKPNFREDKHYKIQKTNPHNLTWVTHSRPGNKTPSVKLSVESEFRSKILQSSGQRPTFRETEFRTIPKMFFKILFVCHLLFKRSTHSASPGIDYKHISLSIGLANQRINRTARSGFGRLGCLLGYVGMVLELLGGLLAPL